VNEMGWRSSKGTGSFGGGDGVANYFRISCSHTIRVLRHICSDHVLSAIATAQIETSTNSGISQCWAIVTTDRATRCVTPSRHRAVHKAGR